jgi:hypothetical protein
MSRSRESHGKMQLFTWTACFLLVQILIIACILRDQNKMQNILVWNYARPGDLDVCDLHSWLDDPHTASANGSVSHDTPCLVVQDYIIDPKGVRSVPTGSCANKCPGPFASWRSNANRRTIVRATGPSLQTEWLYLCMIIGGLMAIVLFERPTECQVRPACPKYPCISHYLYY